DDNAEENVDISDPDDIDALLDSINADANNTELDSDVDSTHLENTPLVDDNAEENVDISDPDDIDALLDSINADANSPDVSASIDNHNPTAEDNADISDPDDIDALLASVSGAAAMVSETAEASKSELTSENNSEQPESENAELINNFSDEYVQSFIDGDFSDLRGESSIDTELDAAESNTGEGIVESPAANEDISDDFDIDALIDEVNQSSDSSELEALDIGDELLDGELQDNDGDSTEVVDDDELAALSTEFDEATITQLLNDEQADDSAMELAPDFNDSNVLADLLSDESDDGEAQHEADEISEASEVDDIKALDNVDFDDLLANIEHESSATNNDDFELDESLDIGDEFEVVSTDDNAEERVSLEQQTSAQEETEKDFISVDTLLSDSLSDDQPAPPYDKMTADVGLSEFPEFSGSATTEDIDDDNGLGAKLDLAKTYLEIGDNEHAEVTLLDIVNRGDAEQKLAAQALLDNIN
ncbi:MAG: FimV/HubP family polar landmark protein, partial [Cognaticolwellia sp.]